jgi:hypothetical protein
MMDWSLWNHLILQLSQHEPFIDDSVIAIGALSKAVDIESAPDNTLDKDSSRMASLHRAYAFLKYGKAVKSMQAILVSGSELRQVLIACLLVYCFEILLHNRHMALSHIVSGHHLLRDWLVRYDRSTPGNHRLLSPDPTTIDDEIIEAFDCMDLQISTIYDSRPVELHRARMLEGLNAVQHMPSKFSNVSEARGYLLIVMRRCHHFLASTWQSSQADFLVRDLEMSPPDSIVVTSGTNIYSTSYKVSRAMGIEQKEFAEDLSRWSQAFEALYQKTRCLEVAGVRNHVAGTLLRIHLISTKIAVSGVLFTEETSYDSFLPLFQELYDLTTIVVDAYQKKSNRTIADNGFFLDLGICSPLYLLVSRCRDHSLRVKAINLLKGWHAEGCWQPKLIAAIGDFLVEVEEDGCVDMLIPEKSRAVITACYDDPQRRGNYEALVQCVQRHGGPNGEPTWHERRLCYSV